MRGWDVDPGCLSRTRLLGEHRVIYANGTEELCDCLANPGTFFCERMMIMHFAQIYTPGLASCSYVLGSGTGCVVVDPARSIQQYVEQARTFGMEIEAVLETHLHADFVSGHIELAEATGADIYAPKKANCNFHHIALEDEQEFCIGKLKFQLLETPGHTPEGAVFLVTDLKRGEDPVMLLSGDTLLVGDVGRPDLFPDQKKELAGQLFNSLERLKSLPDYLEVYPAHGMGSLCGRSLSAKLWSTIGTEKRQNYALQYTDRENFKDSLLHGMPDAPDHFARCSKINRQGPTLISSLAEPQPLDCKEIFARINEGYHILDARDHLTFAAGHIQNAYSISLAGNLPTFAGWILPPEEPLIVVADERNLQAVYEGLYSVGLDCITGYLMEGISTWINAGLPVGHIDTLSVHDLKGQVDTGSLLLLDSRRMSEWAQEHIPGSHPLPAPDVRYMQDTWPQNKPVVTVCGSGIRSMTAASLLKRRGFESVSNLLGGIAAWKTAGYSLQSREGE